MVDRVLIDALTFKGRQLAQHWKDRIREESRLKHYGALSDDFLTGLNESLFSQLARFLEQGLDRSVLGNYFVCMGKESVRHSFPLSETVYGLLISQQVVLKYIENELMLDDPVAMYQGISVIAKIADFFLLGCYYVNKGFQEKTIEKMCKTDNIPFDILTKYYKDDFFFKKED